MRGLTRPSESRPRTDPDERPLPSGAAKTEMVRSMFDTIAPRYDLVNRLITFGMDRWWRHRTVSTLGLPAGSVVLDLACGTGDLLKLLRKQGHRGVGMDLSWGMLAANSVGSPVAQADATSLPLPAGAVDGVVCGYGLRNFSDLRAALAELGRVVRPGGRISLLEVAVPTNPLLRFGHRIWFQRVVPFLGGTLSDPAAYRYLPRSTAYLPASGTLRQLLVEAGFSTVGHRLLSGGLSQLITATRTGLPSVTQPAVTTIGEDATA